MTARGARTSDAILLEQALAKHAQDGALQDLKRMLTAPLFNIRDKQGNSLVALAAGNGRWQVVHYLLTECHANANTFNQDKQTPLDLAIANAHRTSLDSVTEANSIVRLLETHDAFTFKQMLHRCDLLKHSAKGDLENVKQTLIKIVQDRGLTAKFFRCQDAQGNSPLFLAIKSGKLASVKYFMAEGIDMDQRDPSGKTAEEFALSCNHLEIAQYIA